MFDLTIIQLKVLLRTPVFSVVRVTRSLVLCVCFVDCCLSFYPFSFGHSVVCSSLIYGFWLPLWYLQTLLTKTIQISHRHKNHIFRINPRRYHLQQICLALRLGQSNSISGFIIHVVIYIGPKSHKWWISLKFLSICQRILESMLMYNGDNGCNVITIANMIF